jgi:hypothetical protein
MFGDHNKKMLLYTLGVEDDKGQKTTVRDKDGYLDYNKVILVLENIFGGGATQLIQQELDNRIREFEAKSANAST